MPGVFGFIWVAFVFIIVFSTIRKANKEVSKNKGKFSNISGAKNLCSNCGKYVSANAYTCPHCGAALKKKCKNCGQWVNVRSKFCTSCSTPFNDSVSDYSNDTQCTYHDTYSSGYDPHCHNPHDDLSRYTRRRSIDDIGLVKGRGRNKVETVEDYEKARHREGAYHVNVNDVNSNYETTTPEQYSRKSTVTVRSVDGAGTVKTQYGNKTKKKGNGAAAFIVVIFFIIIVTSAVINSVKDNLDSTSSWGDYENIYYSTDYLENLSESEIETNETAKYYLDYAKGLSLTDSNDFNFVIYYNNIEDNTVQCLLYRITADKDSLKGYYYYDAENDVFCIDRYNNNIDIDIYNQTDNEYQETYIQVDYVEFKCQSGETMKENIAIRKNNQSCAFSYAESLNPLDITLNITIN